MIRSNTYQQAMDKGITFLKTGNFKSALDQFTKALDERYSTEALYNTGQALKHLGQVEFALSHFESALELSPANFDIALICGNTAFELQEFEKAAGYYDAAAKIDDTRYEPFLNLGNVFKRVQQLDNEVEFYRIAFEKAPEEFLTNYSLGGALDQKANFTAAINHFKKALEIRPSHMGTLSMLVYAKAKICDWSDTGDFQERLVNEIRRGVRPAKKAECPQPFTLFSFCDDVGTQTTASRLQTRLIESNVEPINPHDPGRLSAKLANGERLRIGYLGNEFCNHATGYLIKDFIRHHNRSKFSVHGFDYSHPDPNDRWHVAIAQEFDQLHYCQHLTNSQIAALIASHEIDVLIDLKGHTTFSRFDVLAHRPAPLQLHYLGYPAPIDADWVDLFVTDTFLSKERKEPKGRHLVLSRAYQCNSKERIQDRKVSKAEVFGRAPEFIFCSFNSSWKINPIVLDAWARIIAACETASLWLLDPGEQTKRNLVKEWQALGMDPSQIIFSGFLDIDNHLQRLTCADVMLDTWPCSGHTTASDAIAAGVPVLTLPGESMISRVAGSLNEAVGLGELNRSCVEDYVESAVALYRQPSELERVRTKLEPSALRVSTLFDPAGLAKEFEDQLIQQIKSPQ